MAHWGLTANGLANYVFLMKVRRTTLAIKSSPKSATVRKHFRLPTEQQAMLLG
jgi:hypothetical protein